MTAERVPPTNAAMKPEPPIASARLNARSAPASGTTWSQVSSMMPAPVPWTTTAAATAPARTPPRMPYPIFSSDELDGMPVSDRPVLCEGDGECDEEERDADPVVETALDVQALADSHRKARGRDDGLAEGRIGRGENDRDEERLGPGEVAEQHQRDGEPGEDRQRESDPEQARGMPSDRRVQRGRCARRRRRGRRPGSLRRRPRPRIPPPPGR